MKRLKLASAVMASVASMSSSALFAQSDDDLDGFFLEEVVVTAQRKAETLQDAAIPVNAATGDQLLNAGVADAVGLGKISPALTVTNGGGANTGYFVRGVGNFANNGYTNPAVAFNLDGVYIGRPSSTVASFLDLNRVEVLKGPQGTLYGRNATGGAVNVIPNTPVLGENSGKVMAEAGNYGKMQLTGVGNFSAGDNAAFRIAATRNELDGWFDDGTGETEDTAVRTQFYVEPSDTFNFRISADYAKQEGNGNAIDVRGIYGFQNPVGGPPFLYEQLATEAAALAIPNRTFTPAPDSFELAGLHSPEVLAFIANNAVSAPLFSSPVSGYAFPFRDDTYWGVNAEFNFDLGFGDLVVIPAYRNSELDNQFNGPPFRAAINQDEAKQSSLEARLSGGEDSFEWILGAYYFDENVKGVNSFNQFSTVTHNAYESNVESSALFARGTFHVSEELRLVGGVRYTSEDRDINANATSTAGVCDGGEGTPGPPNCSAVPNIPVGLTLEDSLEQLDSSLFTPVIPVIPITGNPLDAFDGFPTSPIVRAYGGLGYALLIITPTTIVEEESDSDVTYRAAIEYDVTPDSLLYVSYETGFRAGGFNVTVGQETYDPEEITAVTIGSKNRFLDDRLELNLEAFSWEYTDQQLAALGVDGRGNNSFYSRNVGESTIQGLEVDFQFLVAQNTLIRGGFQALDATYDDFRYTEVDTSSDNTNPNYQPGDEVDPTNFLTPITGCDFTQLLPSDSTAESYGPLPVQVIGSSEDGARRSFEIDCSGQDALFSPDLSVNLGIDQTFDLGSSRVIGSLDLRHRAERWVGFGYHPGAQADDVTTIDASLTYETDAGLTVTLYGNNLTDEYIPSTYQVGAGSVAGSAIEPPRTYGVRLSYDF